MKQLLLVILFLPMMSFGHGGHQAYYVIENLESGWTLTVKMESPDITEELEKNELNTNYMPLGIENYLKGRLEIEFDDQVATRTFNSSYTSRVYIFCSFSLDVQDAEIEKIRVQNTCFKDFDHEYYNLVEIVNNGQKVSYKLDAKRTEVTHNFED